MGIVYSIGYEKPSPRWDPKHLAVISVYMNVAVSAGSSDPKMMTNIVTNDHTSGEKSLSSFDLLIFEESKQAIVNKRERFTKRIRDDLPALSVPSISAH